MNRRSPSPTHLIVLTVLLALTIGGCVQSAPAPAAQPAAAPVSAQPTTAPAAQAAAPAAPAAETAWDAEPMELKVMCLSCLEPGMHEAQEKYRQDFMKLHPNIKVTFDGVPSEQFQQKFVTVASGGNMPDVIEDHNTYVAANAEAGFILPLDKCIDKATADEFLPASIDMLTYKDKLYALQIGMVNTAILYRKDLFDAAGLPAPAMDWTWADFEKYAKAVTKGDVYGIGQTGKADRGNFMELLPFIRANGADVVEQTPDGKWISKADSPAAVEAMAFLGKLVHEDKVYQPNLMSNGYAENMRDLGRGKIAMFATGAHTIGMIEKDYPDAVKDLRSVPFPGKDITSRGWAVAWSLPDTKDEKRQKVACEYLKYITSLENQIAWNDITWWMPTRKAALTASPKMNQAVYDGFKEAAKKVKFYPILPIQPQMDQAGMDAEQAIFSGNTDYQAIAKKFAADINAALEKEGLLGKP
jgi:multiple sugar transport system substrate-binding protein